MHISILKNISTIQIVLTYLYNIFKYILYKYKYIQCIYIYFCIYKYIVFKDSQKFSVFKYNLNCNLKKKFFTKHKDVKKQ